MSKPVIGGFFVSKKVKATIYVVGVLWIAVMSQLLVNRIFTSDTRIMDAFVDTDTNIEESKLNLVVDYGEGFLLNDQREEVLKSLADAVGVKDYKMKTETTKETVNIKVQEKTRKKDTSIEFVTLSKDQGKKTSYHHFVLLEMKLNKDFDKVIQMKKAAEKYVSKWGAKDYQCIIKFSGSYQGQLSQKAIDGNVSGLLKNLQARKVDSVKSENFYSVYAYTGLVKDYIKADGKRININVVVTYNEEEDKTELCLATPVLNEDY